MDPVEREQMPKKPSKPTSKPTSKPAAKPAAKPTSKGADKELRAAVATLEGRLSKARARTDVWKGRAKAAQADAGAVRAKLAKLEKKLEKALAKAAPSALPTVPPKRAATRKAPAKKSAARKAPASTAAPTAPVEPSSTPDLSWTLVRLRQEARRRGVVYTGKSKAQLLSALS